MNGQSSAFNVSVSRTDEDAKLIEASANGNKDAFRELFSKNVSRVYSLCLRISADSDKAGDLTQEVFINAWEKLGTFRHECKFSTWLHRIAVNKWLMMLRSEDAERRKSEAAVQDAVSSQQTSVSDHRIDLEKAISMLPDQARTVLVLHDIEGFKHYEISEMMGIETGTSKAHLHRARKLLREELSK